MEIEISCVFGWRFRVLLFWPKYPNFRQLELGFKILIVLLVFLRCQCIFSHQNNFGPIFPVRVGDPKG